VADRGRICILYDFLFPHTIGGAERWYRNVAERLALAGHPVTYLTTRQWQRGEKPQLEGGVEVVAVLPKLPPYTPSGRRRILPVLLFSLAVAAHLLRHRRRYAVIHTNATPFLPLLTVGLLQPLCSYRLVVDYHELWTARYWRSYLGPVGGTIAYLIQSLCLRFPQEAFCFARLYEARLHAAGVNGPVRVLEGEYAGPLEEPQPRPAKPFLLFAGRLIPEKRPLLALEAFALARKRLPELQLKLLGQGPLEGEVRAAVARLGLEGVVEVPGFVAAERLQELMGEALALLHPSSREGYGMVVIEACAAGTPAIVVAGEDNASCELIEVGVNGYVVPLPQPDLLAEAILKVHAAGQELRGRTASWFGRNAGRLSLERSLATVVATYPPVPAPPAPAAPPAPFGAASS